ncbi:helix-turn-helix domain-containing protein [Mammaliicoccus vitulinus]|uniref:helix-turn-helix domain-containing protein n=1 Tax=Mammaliicoccus vitulinus TaxID=71237 RepID=UPI00248C77B3|nr:helix-turn-helix transcriptional regulator [Mammaliicoccus vitulinus]
MKLQEMRLARNLTQREVAKSAGINLGTYCAYEQDFRSIDGAQLTTLTKLALLFNCKLSELVNDPELVSNLEKLEQRLYNHTI